MKICRYCGKQYEGDRNMVCSDECYDELCDQESENALDERMNWSDMESERELGFMFTEAQ